MTNLARLIFIIAAIVVAVWILGLIFRFAAWLISGLLYVAAIVVITGLIVMFIQRQRGGKN